MMGIDIQIGKHGQDDTSGIEPQEGAVNIPQRVSDLEKRAEDVSESFQKLGRDIEKYQNFTYTVVGAIAIVFVITSILIGLDYFKNNQDRYEKFIEKAEEIEQNFYTRSEIDKNITSSADQIKNQLSDFKECLKAGGWSICLNR
jgi:tetrahydromethanopterin S-methyltransferase subunit G